MVHQAGKYLIQKTQISKDFYWSAELAAIKFKMLLIIRPYQIQ